jgi:hypothetical protein
MEMLTDEAIAATLRAEPDPQAACSQLVAQANDAGGRNNHHRANRAVRYDGPGTREPKINAAIEERQNRLAAKRRAFNSARRSGGANSRR